MRADLPTAQLALPLVVPPRRGRGARPARRPLVRRADGDTPRRAARALGAGDVLSALQMMVLRAVRRHGPITDGALERLPEFAHLAPSTVRKRRTELLQAGHLKAAGVDVAARMQRWEVARG